MSAQKEKQMSEPQTLANSSLLRRQKYKELLERGSELSAKIDNKDTFEALNEISQLIKEANAITKQGQNDTIENATESFLDAQIIKMGHELMTSVVKRMDQSDFSEEDFVNNILQIIKVNGRGEDWNLMGKRIARIPKTAKFGGSFLGVFRSKEELEAIKQEKEKKQQQRQARPKPQLVEMRKPQNVERSHKEETGVKKINSVLEQINKLLKDNGNSIPYYKLVIDPKNFMNSVDNAFQLSFFVRDGTIGIRTGRNGDPEVYSTLLSEAEKRKHESQTMQGISRLNVQVWKKMTEKYKIKEPLIINYDQPQVKKVK